MKVTPAPSRHVEHGQRLMGCTAETVLARDCSSSGSTGLLHALVRNSKATTRRLVETCNSGIPRNERAPFVYGDNGEDPAFPVNDLRCVNPMAFRSLGQQEKQYDVQHDNSSWLLLAMTMPLLLTLSGFCCSAWLRAVIVRLDACRPRQGDDLHPTYGSTSRAKATKIRQNRKGLICGVLSSPLWGTERAEHHRSGERAWRNDRRCGNRLCRPPRRRCRRVDARVAQRVRAA